MLIRNKGIIFLLILNIAIFSFIFISKDISGFYFLDVGQGDSELIILENNLKILIDGGPKNKVIEELEKIIPEKDRYIDIVMLSHPDLDHFGGLVEVLRRYRVGVFLGSGRRGDSFAYDELINQIKEKEIPYIFLKEGDNIKIGDTELNILSPSITELISSSLNDSSLVVHYKDKDISVLYSGDIGFATEKRLVDKYDLKSDILKVPHHGSKYSSSEEFIKEVSPSISVIEVGENSYGHPAKEALERLGRYSKEIFQTKLEGTVSL